MHYTRAVGASPEAYVSGWPMSTAWSIALAVAIGWVVLPALALAAAIRALTLLRSARSQLLATRSPFRHRAGPTAVQGRVDWRGASEPPVRVTLTQTVESQRMNRHGHLERCWVEAERETRMDPFDLVLADGTRIAVEPPPDAKLVDELDRVEAVSPGRRRKHATLDEGEEVWVVGALRPSRRRARDVAYRGAVAASRTDALDAPPARPLVLREPRVGDMLLASGPLAAPLKRQAGFHVLAAVIFAMTTMWVDLGSFGSFHRLLFDGAKTTGVVVDQRSARLPGTSRGNGIDLTFVSVRYRRPGDAADRVTEVRAPWRVYDLARRGEAAGQSLTIPLVVAKHGSTLIQLGEGVYLDGFWLPVLLLCVVAGFVYAGLATRVAPWYERRRVVDWEPADREREATAAGAGATGSAPHSAA